ncbi:MAG: pyridoxamine 5'-phosphate oxidase [Alphaproteobacteria bacterium]|nr:pyridoxamine 5'-phosphate oxidase [Alphaproteobacteria bacterium]
MTREIFEKYGADPVELFKSWLGDAAKTEPHDPEAACLATADAKGHPSARMVLIKTVTEQGLGFHTNCESRKGLDLAENPYAALCFYWKSLRRQIRAEGGVEMIPDSEAESYFSTRSRERRIGAWVSQQSRPYERAEDLASAIRHYEEKFPEGSPVSRPEYWKGYVLKPERIEFWIAHEHRLHTRFDYVRQRDKTWKATWLYP